ncbi:MAG TPA: hypothetical protein VIL45_05630 [Thermoplasmata archaeon]
MARTGFLFGMAVPLALLAGNLVLGYGGILVTAILFVWVGVGVMLLPTAEEEV